MTVKEFMELHPCKKIRVFVQTQEWDKQLKAVVETTKIYNSNDENFYKVINKKVVRFREVNPAFDCGWFRQSPDFCIDEIK